MLSFSRKSAFKTIKTWVYLKADTISRSYGLPGKRPDSVLAVLTIGPYLELPDP